MFRESISLKLYVRESRLYCNIFFVIYILLIFVKLTDTGISRLIGNPNFWSQEKCMSACSPVFWFLSFMLLKNSKKQPDSRKSAPDDTPPPPTMQWRKYKRNHIQTVLSCLDKKLYWWVAMKFSSRPKVLPHPQQYPHSKLIWKSNQRTASGGIRITRVDTEVWLYGATPLKTNTVS